MPLTNSARRYGNVAKAFHWTTALLILANIAMGVIASQLPVASMLAGKALLFTIHKTLGLAIFAVALLRIVWAVTQVKPTHLQPHRKVETFAADLVHWVLYASLVLIPLSGWITHAATEGFAPIWWPFSQNLPGLVQNETVAAVASTAHWVLNWILFLAIAAHVGGALKHHLVDRDATLHRMWFGRTEAGPATAHRGAGPALPAAAALYAIAAVAVVGFSAEALTPNATNGTGTTTRQTGTGNWAVQSGAVGIEVVQFGNTLEGGFDQWSADITFDQNSGTGSVTVQVDISSLRLGSVTEQALGPDYFAAEAHPTATFTGRIDRATDGFVATGPLSLAGATTEIALPFTLDIDGGTARMQGAVTLDRLAFGIGAEQTAGTIALEVPVTVSLTATRVQ